jgi:hypothetical protein
MLAGSDRVLCSVRLTRPDCWRYLVEVQDAGLAPDPEGYR